MDKSFKVRDLRKKDNYRIDDEYLNGYARLCGIFATAVYNSLSRHADFHTQECFPSIDKMAEQHGVNRKSIIYGIKQLEKWGIVRVIKQKDEKTKTQKVNVYILLDKSEWKPKNDSRVPVADSEAESLIGQSRVPVADLSRVPVADYKVIPEEKVTTIKASEAEASPDTEVQKLLPLFEPINISFEKLFSNTTQRKSLRNIINKIGYEKTEKLLRALPIIIAKPYAPRITTPRQLEDKFSDLKVFLQQHQSKKYEKKPTGAMNDILDQARKICFEKYGVAIESEVKKEARKLLENQKNA